MKGKRLIFSIFCLLIIMSNTGNAADSITTDIGRSEVNSVRPVVAPSVGQSIKNDISEPLSSIVPIPTSSQPSIKVRPLLRRQPPLFKQHEPDPVAQQFFTLADIGSKAAFLNIPSIVQNFEGVNNVNGVLPPDSNGDVGLNHYVQWVNLSFSIYNKSGISLYGPVAGKTLWSGFGGPCQTDNDGDPIVLYDRQADRWMMSQFALPNYPNGPFYQCIAVSVTGDPTGSWYRYAFLFSNTKFNDYAKFGIWSDGYYMSANQFNSSSYYVGVGVVAFERSRMLQGLSAQSVYFDLNSVDPNLYGMLPSHLNGPDAPPSGSPNYFIQFDDGSPDQLQIWGFHVDWTTTANSTFSLKSTLPTAAFDSNMCGYDPNCIPQPVTSAKVDAISDKLMNRLQYRNFGPFETMVVNHTVDVDGSDHAGIRWYELRNSGGGWSILQQGTYSPDSDHRWMGSAALDGMENVALGYSVSGTNTYPSIRYTGRLSSDTPGLLPQGEGTIIEGSGYQTSSTHRWGDYSSMSIDPSDDSTFWYTQQYYSAPSSFGWQTRIGAFSLCSLSRARTQGPVYSSTLQGAYGNAAQSGDTVAVQSVTFRENLDLNGGKSITLKGGYNCFYSTNPLRTTIIGSLIVSTGSVIVDNISIQ